MNPDQPSRTAQYVAFLRALGNLAPQVPGFQDPMAERLLPPRWSNRVLRARARLAKHPGRSPFPLWHRAMGIAMQFRTVGLDQAIRSAPPFDQLVILGAGLDGRAWRLPALARARVFELDHPATQAWKREIATPIAPLAREVRFVPIDFGREDPAERLPAAGFDPGRTTFWLWEGVAMYLAPEAVLRTLAATAGLSAPGSRLALTYRSQQREALPLSFLLATLGEPYRSAFAPAELAEAAHRAGWDTLSDSGVRDWKRELDLRPGLPAGQETMPWNERIWVGQVTNR
jgi:methyltransferase (TIGR00027 family)